MKFTAEQKELVKAASFASAAITAKTTLAIQKGILIRVTDNGTLILTGSDKELGIEKALKLTGDFEPGSVVLQSKLFLEIIRKLPNRPVTVEFATVDNVRIYNDISNFSLVGNESDEYPDIGSVNEKVKIKIDREAFISMIRRTTFAASRDESRGTVTGILMEIHDNTANVVALDGFRMAVANENIESTADASLIITARVISSVASLLSDSEFTSKNDSNTVYENDNDEQKSIRDSDQNAEDTEDKAENGDDDLHDKDDIIEILADDKHAVINSESSKIIMSLLKGEFIDYKRIIPNEFTTHTVVENEMLTDSISRASLFAAEGRNNLVRLTVKQDSINIFANSESGRVEENIPASTDGDDIQIGFNAKYLLDGLKAFSGDELELSFIAPIKPCIIREKDQESYMYMILPVRLMS